MLARETDNGGLCGILALVMRRLFKRALVADRRPARVGLTAALPKVLERPIFAGIFACWVWVARRRAEVDATRAVRAVRDPATLDFVAVVVLAALVRAAFVRAALVRAALPAARLN